MTPDCTHNTTGLAFIETQEFFVTYCITFVFFVLCVVPVRVKIADSLHKLLHFNIFTGIFRKIHLKGETLVSQVMLLLGTTPSENTQIHHRNTPEDISDILGTRFYKRYVDTPLQTLDGIIINQPKHFLPLTEKTKRFAEEIRIEKINEQWAGIP